MDQNERAKQVAAIAALDYVKDGMVLGLGSGTTAQQFIRVLQERVGEGLRIAVVPTSRLSGELAAAAGMPVIEMPDSGVDLAVDGADLVTEHRDLIKGRGGAHVREKLVALAAKKIIIIVDDAKVQSNFHGKVPIEILHFGAKRTLMNASAKTGALFEFRKTIDDGYVVSDNGGYLADGSFTTIDDPHALAGTLDSIPGIIGHGLFLDMNPEIIVGNSVGTVRILTPAI